jgi:hypothetical protein
MQRSPVVIRSLVQTVPWFSLALVAVVLAFAMNTLVTHGAGAVPTVSSVQPEQRESFIQKRTLRCAENDATPCVESAP